MNNKEGNSATYPLRLTQRPSRYHRRRRRPLIRLLILAHPGGFVHAPPRRPNQHPRDLVANRLRWSMVRHDGEHLGFSVAMVWPGGWGGADMGCFFGGEKIAEMVGGCGGKGSFGCWCCW